jgi:hypothetical protein
LSEIAIMKSYQLSKMFLIICITVFFTNDSSAQKGSALQPYETVYVKFKNNSILFRNVKVIAYQPGIPGNSTEGLVLRPYEIIRKKYQIGTRIYFANAVQIDTVMSGNSLRGKPFLQITKDDAGKTFDIEE